MQHKHDRHLAFLLSILGVLGAADAGAEAPAVDVLQELAAAPATVLDLGLVRAQRITDALTREHHGERLGSAAPTFYEASVLAYGGSITLAGYFSVYWETDVTRGNCADALEALRAHLLDAHSPSGLARALFSTPQVTRTEAFYSDVADRIEVFAGIGADDDWKHPAIGCASGLEPNGAVTFETR